MRQSGAVGVPGGGDPWRGWCRSTNKGVSWLGRQEGRPVGDRKGGLRARGDLPCAALGIALS